MMISAQQYFSGRISDEMKFIFNYQRFDVFIVSFIWLSLFLLTLNATLLEFCYSYRCFQSIVHHTNHTTQQSISVCVMYQSRLACGSLINSFYKIFDWVWDAKIRLFFWIVTVFILQCSSNLLITAT